MEKEEYAVGAMFEDDGVIYKRCADGNLAMQVYPMADKQAPSVSKYMTYSSIQTGAPGKSAK